jgi:hypothetical protein
VEPVGDDPIPVDGQVERCADVYAVERHVGTGAVDDAAEHAVGVGDDQPRVLRSPDPRGVGRVDLGDDVDLAVTG